MVMCMKINCINIQKCFRIWHSRLPESVTCCATRQICFGQRGLQMLEMQKRGSSIMSYNLQLEDMMDKSVRHSIDLIVTSPIQVSLLLTTDYNITPLLTTIYIKSFLSYIHTSTVTAINYFRTIQKNSWINATKRKTPYNVTTWH